MAGVILMTHLFLAELMTETTRVANAELLAEAEATFHNGREARGNPNEARPLFHKAALCYEELRRRGAHSADLYRNQGNCYLLAGNLPQAILAYRRALRLAPSDAILRANLTHAREQVAFPNPSELGRPPADNRPPWLPHVSPRLGLPLFVGFYSLGWLSFVRWWMVSRAAPLGVAILAFVLAAFLGAGFALEDWSECTASSHPLVVIATDGLPLRKGNGVLYPSRFESRLNRGVEARLQFERGDWLQIELASGAVGWVPRAAVLLDRP